MMYGIIMAGGVGKRFWPMSRNKKPKQFLKLFGHDSMIQMTYNRLQPVIPPEKIFVITNKDQAKLTSEHLPSLPANNIVAEPMGKDTAPCIGLGAILAMARDPEALMVVLPADHLIPDVYQFQKTIEIGADYARENSCLLTIGIHAARPETGYGYIQVDNESGNKKSRNYKGREVFKVKTFAEKPNLATAKRFIESGDFLWNSGIFIWKASSILHEIEELLPELYDTLMDLRKHIGKDSFKKALFKAYSHLKSISIDYGVMEKARNVSLLKGDFEWSDVGNWEEFYKLGEKDKYGNVVIGSCELKNSHNNLIISDKNMIAVTGINGMTIVNSGNATLICPRSESQDIKEIVDSLNRKKENKYL